MLLEGLFHKSSTCLGLCEFMSSAPLVYIQWSSPRGRAWQDGPCDSVTPFLGQTPWHAGPQASQHAAVEACSVRGCAGMTNRDMERERERRQWEADELQELDDLQAKHARIDERLEVRAPPVLPMLGAR